MRFLMLVCRDPSIPFTAEDPLIVPRENPIDR